MTKLPKIILIIIGLIVLFFGWRAAIYFVDIAKTAVQEELALGQVSGTNYTFYYPKDWRKGQEPGAELAFFAVNEQGEETGEGISLEISSPGNKQMETATDEICQTFATIMANTNPKLPGQVASAIAVNTQIYEGCKIINQFAVNGIEATSEVKIIWYKDRRDNTLYTSQANYFSDTTENMKSTIKDSVGLFSIR